MNLALVVLLNALVVQKKIKQLKNQQSHVLRIKNKNNNKLTNLYFILVKTVKS